MRILLVGSPPPSSTKHCATSIFWFIHVSRGLCQMLAIDMSSEFVARACVAAAAQLRICEQKSNAFYNKSFQIANRRAFICTSSCSVQYYFFIGYRFVEPHSEQQQECLEAAEMMIILSCFLLLNRRHAEGRMEETNRMCARRKTKLPQYASM